MKAVVSRANDEASEMEAKPDELRPRSGNKNSSGRGLTKLGQADRKVTVSRREANEEEHRLSKVDDEESARERDGDAPRASTALQSAADKTSALLHQGKLLSPSQLSLKAHLAAESERKLVRIEGALETDDAVAEEEQYYLGDVDENDEEEEEEEDEAGDGAEEERLAKSGDAGYEAGGKNRLSPRLHDIEEEDDEEGRNIRER
ncbi:hypothetical protein QAD02_024402 [Eretmocerus hayati]|uniref:Uncharacterized protein n=1 Tax=Eretmocerus hayati TaxID=131215 RepID=A0ACC2PYZ2_9HYME|nr:hypothetical protein QAD02_024402 [Eretmocerus hayati]